MGEVGGWYLAAVRYAGKSAIVVALAALALTAAPGASARFAPTAAFSVLGTHGYTVRFEAQGKGGQVLFGHGRL